MLTMKVAERIPAVSAARQAGKVWRVGLMGFGAKKENALRLVQSLRAII